MKVEFTQVETLRLVREAVALMFSNYKVENCTLNTAMQLSAELSEAPEQDDFHNFITTTEKPAAM